MSTFRYRKVVAHDITDWEQKPQVSHYGKRLKDVYEHPKRPGTYFYFKQSDHRYPWELWSEVIASRLADMFSIPAATYNPAVIRNHSDLGDLWGCTSKLVHNFPFEEFTHGQEFLVKIDPSFDIERGERHSYGLIREVFNSEGLAPIDWLRLHQMLVLDALIGNRDRHQENWAVISSPGRIVVHTGPEDGEKGNSSLRFVTSTGEIKVFRFEKEQRLAPIYDSGTSLGHNLTEEGIQAHLESAVKMSRYAFGPKAKSHIRWEGQKLPHFSLLSRIVVQEPEVMREAIASVTLNFSPKRVERLLKMVDKDYDHDNPTFAITPARKEFILRLLILRAQKLEELLSSIKP